MKPEKMENLFLSQSFENEAKTFLRLRIDEE